MQKCISIDDIVYGTCGLLPYFSTHPHASFSSEVMTTVPGSDKMKWLDCKRFKLSNLGNLRAETKNLPSNAHFNMNESA